MSVTLTEELSPELMGLLFDPENILVTSHVPDCDQANLPRPSHDLTQQPSLKSPKSCIRHSPSNPPSAFHVPFPILKSSHGF